MNVEGPKVSIVCSVYNGRPYLDDLESYIGSQSFDDYELIFVVDTRSDDGTLGEVERYCSSNPKARLVLQKGTGRLGGSKNIGIDNSKGRYIWFLDVDDTPSKDFLKRMVSAKESTDSDIAVCNYLFIDKNGWDPYPEGDIITLNGKDALHARSLNLFPVTSWSMLYDRQFILDNGLRFLEQMSEDIGFTYTALDVSERVCFVTEPLYGYYLNQASFCNSNMDERGISELENYLYLSEYFPKTERYLQSRLCLICMRSLTHMTASGLKGAIKDPRLERNVKDYLSLMNRIEYRLARIFPSVYRWGGAWYIRNFYKKVGKVYTDSKKMNTLRSIAKE